MSGNSKYNSLLLGSSRLLKFCKDLPFRIYICDDKINGASCYARESIEFEGYLAFLIIILC